MSPFVKLCCLSAAFSFLEMITLYIYTLPTYIFPIYIYCWYIMRWHLTSFGIQNKKSRRVHFGTSSCHSFLESHSHINPLGSVGLFCRCGFFFFDHFLVDGLTNPPTHTHTRPHVLIHFYMYLIIILIVIVFFFKRLSLLSSPHMSGETYPKTIPAYIHIYILKTFKI